MAASPTGAWGFEPHRFIMARAVSALPAEIRPFFERHRVFVVEHAIDPDLWRTVGFDEEPPRHFLDIDAYGAPPFTELPREYDAAVRAHGLATITANGVLPWRTAEVYEQLVEAFASQQRSRGGFALERIKLWSAVLSHYVSDAYVPFHAVVNYDGQLTGQRGIHARFESELFRRYRDRLVVEPLALPDPANSRDLVFDAIIAGAALVPQLLEADRVAASAGRGYDDRYFERFWRGARQVLERRLAEAVAAVAALIRDAWEDGGRPPLA